MSREDREMLADIHGGLRTPTGVNPMSDDARVSLAKDCKLERRKLTTYPLRRCRYTHSCCVCNGTLIIGESYYDGGYARRAHRLCAENSSKEGW